MGISRRTFLWLTGGSSIALATNPQRKLVNQLVPLVVPPEAIPSGEWALYATTCRECPAGCGMHLWHRDGRVTKAEGNPDHPVNRGGLCPRGHSSLQGVYDPDRVKGVRHRPRGGSERSATWEGAISDIAGKLASGARAAVISSVQTGTLAQVMRSFAGAFPPQRLLFYEPLHYEYQKAAHRQLFGLPVVPQYRLDRCDFILSFAADFLESWVSPVSFASQFGEMRAWRPDRPPARMAYAGPRLSMTAANADLFLRLPPGGERLLALAMLRMIMEKGLAKRDITRVKPLLDRALPAGSQIPGVTEETVLQLVTWFTGSKGSVALPGPLGSFAPYAQETAAACALLNYAAGRVGETVDFSRPHAVGEAAGSLDLQRFLATLDARDVLFIHDSNLLYSFPQGARQVQRAGTVVYLGTMPDETARIAEWVLPVDSPLEAWGDYDPTLGVHSLQQPTMGRTTDSRLAGDIFLDIARAAGKHLSAEGVPPDAAFQRWLSARWETLHRQHSAGNSFEEFWKSALRSGGVWVKGAPAATVALRGVPDNLFGEPVSHHLDAAEVELWPWAGITLFDGRVSNRPWLQEAPDPVTFISWGNWIDLHPTQAAAMQLADGDVAELSNSLAAVRAPVRITEEVPERVAALSFGQGHRTMGRHAAGTGANVFALLGAPEPGPVVPVCRLRKVGEKRLYDPTYTTLTRNQFDRKLLQWQNLSDLAKKREGEELDWPLPEGYRKEKDLYPKREYLSYRWAMAIDLQRCIGCGACAVSCYAENNVAVMGKKQVARQLEMAWLRVVPYRKEGKVPGLAWLPMLCQHCDSAPCEPVCPVYAAVHNEEGLNAQVYNRCIGTRYCNNNCPYKVRRFNWLNVEWPKPLDLQLNPEVTVRSRGVMEKCTFCIQRIRNAEYRAVREGRAVRDGEIQPACGQSCPTRVYTFGNLLDPHSKVSQLVRTDPRRYQVLHELNTKPAVIYLRRVENDSA
ncbi:4Fe-4S dicluster domain-containing protein [Geomonas sp. RF6]|uniref:4Fe-4S dicluster domain-containing protein n=1 Tax=Geomonas sp. RF6 TaxID=2897342 RepID=UPI001E627F3E|nr:4Fe-4S dicluster domain-containing protein [Geomonas sp. RF6]UFS70375.1 4Fe-4S dicluster domain-containing protein [Geomonas sp. RF6]